MKMKRNLIILGIVAVLVVGFAIAADKLKPSASPSASPTATVDAAKLSLSNRKTTDVTQVEVKNDKQTFVLTKNGDNYVIKGQEGLKLDQTQAGVIFGNVAIITGQRLIEENPKDLSIYGLDKPKAIATATYIDGTTGVYLVGNKTPTDDAYYFMKQGDTKVVTVYTSYGDSFFDTADSLLAKEAITLVKEDIDTVKVLKGGNTALEMTSTVADNVSISNWKIAKPWERAVDSQQLDTYLTAIVGVTVDSVVEGNPKDLAKYGLDKPSYDITISGKGKTNELIVGGKKDDTYTYAKFGDSPIVYQVETSMLSFTGTTAYMLMDKTIILVNIPSVTSVEFQGLGQQGTMLVQQTPQKDDSGQIKKDSNGNTQYDQTFSINGKAVDDKVARYYYQICIGLQTHSLIPEGKSPSSDTPVATLIYNRNSDPTQIKIEFLPYDEDFYAVRMNSGTYFLIAKEKLQTLADSLAKLEAGTLTVPQS